MISNCFHDAATEVERECTTTKPNWLELPRDLTQNILERLGTIEITNACQVCPLWWNICKDPHMWRTIHIIEIDFSHYRYKHLVKICRNAVERSCGQLEAIDIEEFVKDDLLQYIADRANELRHIRLVKCRELSHKGFSEAVKKLPMLEELDISYNPQLSKDSLEIVGCCCPNLKSLKYCISIFHIDGDIEPNEEAFAIAKTMSGLRRLKLYGYVLLTSKGILAILDGCPLLEFLDLEQTVLSLNVSLKKRCLEQIKDVILPYNYKTVL